MSDRILVLHEGRITAEIARDDATEESVMFAATGQEPTAGQPAAARWLRPTAVAPCRRGGRRRRGSLGAVARQRELSLVVIMVVLGASRVRSRRRSSSRASNLTQVTVLASIIAIAAVGEAIVIITRNVDLSVEAMIGLVAFVVADILAHEAPADAGRRSLFGDRARARPRDGQRRPRRGPPRAVDRRDARHPVHLSRLRLPARRRQAGHADRSCRAGYTDAARRRSSASRSSS